MLSTEIDVPNLEAFKNKPHCIRFANHKIFQHVSSTSVAILCSI
jgi:hypothetical protein